MEASSLHVRKCSDNPLLQRKQFAVEIRHPGKAAMTKQEVRDKLSKMFKITDSNRIIVGGFVSKFGGGITTGFGRIYESSAAALKFERNYLLARLGIAEKKTAAVMRRAKKDIRVKRKKARGVAKAKIGAPGKK